MLLYTVCYSMVLTIVDTIMGIIIITIMCLQSVDGIIYCMLFYGSYYSRYYYGISVSSR